jgi:hypothetical protein
MSTYDFEPDPSDYGPEPAHIANQTKKLVIEALRNDAPLRELSDAEINAIWSEPLDRSKLSPFGLYRIREIIAASRSLK